MLKLLGAVMIFGSCAALGLSARQMLSRRVAAADAMLLALALMESEISARRTPLPTIFTELAENEQPLLHQFFGRLDERLRAQDGLSLSYLWRATCRDAGEQIGLGREERDILTDAANFLGRYNADEQLAGLRQISRRLAAARELASGEMQNKGNLYRTCGIAMGLLVVLVLI